jgi:hypothetical protein
MAVTLESRFRLVEVCDLTISCNCGLSLRDGRRGAAWRRLLPGLAFAKQIDALVSLLNIRRKRLADGLGATA